MQNSLVKCPSLSKISAADLFSLVRKFKTGNEEVIYTDGKTYSVAELLGPKLVKYGEIYDDIELRAIIGELPALKETAYNMDTSELHERLRNLRVLLAQPIVAPFDYIYVSLNIEGYNFAYISILIGDPISINYISIGDSLKSCDGEWRNIVTNYSTYKAILAKYAKEIDLLIEAAAFKENPTIDIFCKINIKEEVSADIRELLLQNNFARNLAVLAWFIGQYEKTVNLTQPMSSAFSSFVSLGGIADIAKIFASQDAESLYLMIGSFYDGRPSRKNMPLNKKITRVGQKIIQMSSDDISHIGNPLYQIWNEIEVMQTSISFLLNMISPTFAIHSFFHYIYESSKYLYNIESTKAYIESEKNKLTNVSMLITNEYCGPSLIFALSQPSMRPATLHYGKKYIFEATYGMFCLHSLLGQFHGDFHPGNVTIKNFGAVSAEIKKHTSYIINDDTYTFLHNGSHSCIVDFSRSVKFDSPKWIELVIQKYENYFSIPSEAEYNAFTTNVIGALDNSSTREYLVHIASAFDIYEFASSCLTQCRNELKDSELGDLLGNIRDYSEKVLRSILDTKKSEVTWPAYSILKKYWKPDTSPPKTICVGAFCYNNPLKYSVSSYDSLPRFIAKDPIIRDKKDKAVDTYANFGKIIKLKYEFDLKKNESAE